MKENATAPDTPLPMSTMVDKTSVIMPDYLVPLSAAEQKRRDFIEGEMRKHREGFIAFSMFLLEVNQDRLYRSTHPTFELYLRDVWDLSRQMGYLLMSSGDLAKQVNTRLDEGEVKVKNERQARALKPLISAGYEVENVVKVWRSIVKMCQYNDPKSDQIKAVVDTILHPEMSTMVDKVEDKSPETSQNQGLDPTMASPPEKPGGNNGNRKGRRTFGFEVAYCRQCRWQGPVEELPDEGCPHCGWRGDIEFIRPERYPNHAGPEAPPGGSHQGIYDGEASPDGVSVPGSDSTAAPITGDQGEGQGSASPPVGGTGKKKPAHQREKRSPKVKDFLHQGTIDAIDEVLEKKPAFYSSSLNIELVEREKEEGGFFETAEQLLKTFKEGLMTSKDFRDCPPSLEETRERFERLGLPADLVERYYDTRKRSGWCYGTPAVNPVRDLDADARSYCRLVLEGKALNEKRYQEAKKNAEHKPSVHYERSHFTVDKGLERTREALALIDEEDGDDSHRSSSDAAWATG